MRSDNVTKGVERAPNRSLFYALGYTKEELDTKLDGYATDEEAATAAAEAVTNAQATDEEYQAAMNEVWTPSEDA